MPTLKVAHIREQGVDVIIVPLDANFDHQPGSAQQEAMDEIQSHATAAGLAGAVSLVWPSGGRMKFLAPPSQHAFYRSLNLHMVQRNLNKTISW